MQFVLMCELNQEFKFIPHSFIYILDTEQKNQLSDDRSIAWNLIS